ncbi:MAG: pantetheine-phosphate adenylyltransferase [SAR324 cluster bacterium]|uniref:Phosphopantetheine adenylyltransferase n=1 Tax=SAR324 cluster bacterium TaxID=2024889 RepID=A0A2A4T507_9DELT|nr:MAG: pantetheine-phosphate adenylyltransferase [SAR324 cluster bacterium]
MVKESAVVYPISANPPTYGHADIMMRAARKFDRVYWVAAVDPEKIATFSVDVKLEMMRDYVDHYKLTNVVVEHWGGSLVRYVLQKEARFIIRGIRNTSDLHAEMDLATGYRGVDDDVETICFFSNPQLVMLSSTLVRQLAQVGERIDKYVLPSVEEKVMHCLQLQRAGRK